MLPSCGCRAAGSGLASRTASSSSSRSERRAARPADRGDRRRTAGPAGAALELQRESDRGEKPGPALFLQNDVPGRVVDFEVEAGDVSFSVEVLNVAEDGQ